MANRGEHIKLTGDTHPPEVEWDPAISATPSEIGLQSRPALYADSQSGDDEDEPVRESQSAYPTRAAATGHAGKVVAGVVIGLVLLVLFR